MKELERKVMTLVLVRQGGRVLLGMKKEGLGAGRWNGFGGKVKSSESIEDAAQREIFEEAGITVTKIEKVGVCEFYSPVRPFVVEMHIFSADKFTGEPAESDEMRPQWFEVAELPRSEMWQSDLYWWPYFLDGKKFKGVFRFDEIDAVVEHEIKEIE
jgi:8-oxo-dGTP diphosphatase/2-hydroxy-dATP diphosphatase